MISYTYLADKDDLNNFGANDIARYNYVGLFGFGARHAGIELHEINLICVSVAKIMRDECLFVSAHELAGLKKGNFLKSVFAIFQKPKDAEAFVGLATVCPGINNNILLSPKYRLLDIEPYKEERYKYYAAINNCIEELFYSLKLSSLNEFVVHWKDPKKMNMVIPNGQAIREIMAKEGSPNDVKDRVREYSKPKDKKLGYSSLERSVKYEPKTISVIERVAECFKAEVPDLILKEVVPNISKLAELRKETKLSNQQLAMRFGIGSSSFFKLLEMKGPVPSDVLRFVYDKYSQFFDRSENLVELIDLKKTQALASN